jgi:hypothetical protein
MNDHVVFDLDVGLYPRRCRIDDRDTCEHVPLVDAVAQSGGCGGKLGAGIDPFDRERIRHHVHSDRLPAFDQQSEGVGHVQLSLDVV